MHWPFFARKSEVFCFPPNSEEKRSARDAGWWLSPTPLKNDGVKVSWDYDIPNCFWKKPLKSIKPL